MRRLLDCLNASTCLVITASRNGLKSQTHVRIAEIRCIQNCYAQEELGGHTQLRCGLWHVSTHLPNMPRIFEELARSETRARARARARAGIKFRVGSRTRAMSSGHAITRLLISTGCGRNTISPTTARMITTGKEYEPGRQLKNIIGNLLTNDD
jgi:hypothetical protein